MRIAWVVLLALVALGASLMVWQHRRCAAHGLKMAALMAELASGPMHVGRALRRAGHEPLLPGHRRQLADTQATITVPILDLL